MWAGGVFLLLAPGSHEYYLLPKCMNTVLTKKGCKVAQIHTQDNKYACIRVKKDEKNCTILLFTS